MHQCTRVCVLVRMCARGNKQKFVLAECWTPRSACESPKVPSIDTGSGTARDANRKAAERGKGRNHRGGCGVCGINAGWLRTTPCSRCTHPALPVGNVGIEVAAELGGDRVDRLALPPLSPDRVAHLVLEEAGVCLRRGGAEGGCSGE
jgi:hypothetical protein